MTLWTMKIWSYRSIDTRQLTFPSTGLLELWPTRHGDLQWLQGGQVLQGLLSAQGLGGARQGLQRIRLRPRIAEGQAGQQASG